MSKLERRSASMSLSNMLGIPASRISPESAMRLTSVFACVRVLAETIAGLPLQLFRKTSIGKDIANDHYLFPILHDSPNDIQTAFEFRETIIGHLCLRGNAYVYKEVTSSGKVKSLFPLNPARMRAEVTSMGMKYTYTDTNGKVEYIPSEYIWHVRGFGTDGYIGLSPIAMAEKSIDIGLSAENMEEKFLSNYGRMGNAIKYPGRLNPQQRQDLLESWKKNITGDNAYSLSLLEGGAEFQNVGISNTDAQFMELRNFQVEDIARVFRVPCILIGHSNNTSTYASAEQFMLSFITHTILPYCVRIEQSISKNLISLSERGTIYPQHNLEGLIRGNIESRYRAYAIGVAGTWLSPNEVRAREDMNPRDGGDMYQNPNITIKGA
ncbi:MAG: phage portal protein [Bacteroidetes bacterium]|nr:MAG: phage portal protein [Bacteroidota bacterium]